MMNKLLCADKQNLENNRQKDCLIKISWPGGAMNRFSLDEDLIIQADMSSDPSPSNGDYFFRQKQVNLRDLGFHFSRYCQEIKRQMTKQLTTISRDFNNLTSCFLDETFISDTQNPAKIIQLLKSWVPKLQHFQQKFKELKSHLPYIPSDKKKHQHEEPRRIKFIQILERTLSKFDVPSKHQISTNGVETPSKIRLSFQISKIQHLHDQGRYEQCILRSKQQILLQQSPELYFILANCYKCLGSYHEAVVQYSKAIGFASRGCYYNNRGNAYLSMNQIERAEKDYKAAIDLQPKNQVFLGNFGNICLSMNKFKLAIQVYKKAIDVDQGNDFFYNNLAFAQIKLGDMNGAIQSYNQAINLNPNNHIYLKNRANLFMEKNVIHRALEDIKKAIYIQPKHEYYFLYGKWQYRSGRHHDAMNSFQKACSLEPNKETYKKLYFAIKAQLEEK